MTPTPPKTPPPTTPLTSAELKAAEHVKATEVTQVTPPAPLAPGALTGALTQGVPYQDLPPGPNQGTPVPGKTAYPGSRRPSLGRIVLYNRPATGRTPASQSPGIITGVNPDGTVSIAIFGPHAALGSTGYDVVYNVRASAAADAQEPATWTWPALI